MANPAELLHKQLKTWNAAPNQRKRRGLDSSNEIENWAAQRNAVQNLENLIQLMDEMESAGKSVELERSYLPQWVKAVYVFPTGWESQTAKLTNQSALDMLQSFSHRIDETLIPIAVNAREDMLKAADEAESFLKADIPKALKLLIHEAVSFLRKAVSEYEITGEFVLNTAVKKFVQTMELLIEAEPERTKDFKTKLVTRLSNWYNKTIVQMALAGFVSAELALAAPVVNETAAELTAESAQQLKGLIFGTPDAIESVEPETSVQSEESDQSPGQ